MIKKYFIKNKESFKTLFKLAFFNNEYKFFISFIKLIIQYFFIKINNLVFFNYFSNFTSNSFPKNAIPIFKTFSIPAFFKTELYPFSSI